MKRLLVFVFAVTLLGSCGTGVKERYTFIPDEKFEQAIIDLGLDDVIDGKVLVKNIDSLKYLNVSMLGISDLKGIEAFTALTHLNCSFNYQIDSLDVSKNKALIDLNCRDNKLTFLDVSNNTALMKLICPGTKLTGLDVSNNTDLTHLVFTGSPITSLKLNKNTDLTNLDCSYSQLTSLDVSKNTALTHLHCFENQLTSLDVSKNTALTHLDCSYNQLTSLDVSKNTSLTHLRCTNNQLTSLDVSLCTRLTKLLCRDNQLTSLDVSNHKALIDLNCASNEPLTCLNLKNGNNVSMSLFFADNPNLTCVEVDDPIWSTSNWGSIFYTYSTNCKHPAGCF